MSKRFMRCRGKCKIYVLTFILILGISVSLNLYFEYSPLTNVTVAPTPVTRVNRHLSKLITVIFRQYDEFDNDVTDSVRSFATTFPNMPVLVLSDTMPYPPFQFSTTNETLKNVRVMSLELRMDAVPEEINPLTYVNTEYVLFAPDAIRASRRVLHHAISLSTSSKHAIAIGVSGSYNALVCMSINWSYVDWSVSFKKIPDNQRICQGVVGHHAVLLRTSILHTLLKPFALPCPEVLYLQTSVRKILVQMAPAEFTFDKGHADQSMAVKKQSQRRNRERRYAIFKELGIKAIIRGKNAVRWFGCRKDTQRCFPPVQGPPSYILAGRNTPPCCLENLRRTLKHVLSILITSGGRCWLESTTLLGAVVNKDLLPYVEYAEVGVHANDISHIDMLTRGGVDSEGFVWERATKGRYYRVAYSQTNRIYVLILPFVAKNGSMWPDDWVLAHQKEFPERHLHPLAQPWILQAMREEAPLAGIVTATGAAVKTLFSQSSALLDLFLLTIRRVEIRIFDRQAPAPNDAQAFLDLKLGPNALERSEWLGPKLLYP